MGKLHGDMPFVRQNLCCLHLIIGQSATAADVFMLGLACSASPEYILELIAYCKVLIGNDGQKRNLFFYLYSFYLYI